jgi:hypothetical protein
VSEQPTDRQVIKQLFSNPTSRNLLALWSRVTGSRFPIKVVCELSGSTEDSVEGKIQAMAGLGLVHILAEARTGRLVEFLPCPNPDLKTFIDEFLESRKAEFISVESKVRSLVYITLLNTPS